jgi:hypothetical protein
MRLSLQVAPINKDVLNNWIRFIKYYFFVRHVLIYFQSWIQILHFIRGRQSHGDTTTYFLLGALLHKIIVHTNIQESVCSALNTQALKPNTKELSALQKQLAHKRFHGGTGGNMMGSKLLHQCDTSCMWKQRIENQQSWNHETINILTD